MSDFKKTQVLVTGAGRGGTNLGIELVRALGISTTTKVEDRTFFDKKLPDEYATKLATENKGFTFEKLSEKMNQYEDLKIIFVTRHPFDNILSKIRRGAPKSKGGDNNFEETMPDGTLLGATKAVEYAYSILESLKKSNFHNRVKIIKMEDIILQPKETVDVVAKFLNKEPTNSSYTFYKNNRNMHQKARYCNKLSKNQVDLYTNLDSNFEGYFLESKKNILPFLYDKVKDIAIKNGYDVKRNIKNKIKNLLILYPHGLGDCILLTPAIREYYKATGQKVHVATLERFKNAQLFHNNPYVDKIFYTKDAWHDYENAQVGFKSLYQEWKMFAKKIGFDGLVMPMHSTARSKIILNLESLGVRNAEDYTTEIYTSEEDKIEAEKIIYNLVGNSNFGFIQTKTGVKSKDLPKGFGKEWLKTNKKLNNFIEIGVDFEPLDYNINIQFEIMRKASAVCLPDSVFYHACHAIGKKVDFAYFGRGKGVYDRVKHIVSSEEKVVFEL